MASKRTTTTTTTTTTTPRVDTMFRSVTGHGHRLVPDIPSLINSITCWEWVVELKLGRPVHAAMVTQLVGDRLESLPAIRGRVIFVAAITDPVPHSDNEGEATILLGSPELSRIRREEVEAVAVSLGGRPDFVSAFDPSEPGPCEMPIYSRIDFSVRLIGSRHPSVDADVDGHCVWPWVELIRLDAQFAPLTFTTSSDDGS